MRFGKASRREFLQAVGFGAGTALLSGCTPAASQAAAPNVVFLLTDDQRADALGCSGNSVIRTPHIDQLASDGVRFTNAFVTTSICPVSRASILTGQYMRRHGVTDFSRSLPPEAMHMTYPRLMRRAGYYTGFIGKWGIGTSRSAAGIASRSFDYWAGAAYQGNYWHEATCPYVTSDGLRGKLQSACTCGSRGDRPREGREGLRDAKHMTTEITPTKCAQFLDSRDRSRPFCLSVSFKAPHQPGSDFDPRLRDMYAGQEMPLSETASVEDSVRQPGFLMASRSGAGGARVAPSHVGLQQKLRDYYRLITGIDTAVGWLRAAIAERGLEENTVFVLTSDNGQLFGENGLTGKWLMHEASIRVPLVIFDPRLPAQSRGRTSDEMALNIDIAPTLLDFAGVTPPENMQGASLVPLLADPERAHRDDWFYEHHFRSDRYAIESTEGVRTRRWKYTRYIDQDPHYEQLFDLETDPLERSNLVGEAEHEERLQKMRWLWSSYRERLA